MYRLEAFLFLLMTPIVDDLHRDIHQLRCDSMHALFLSEDIVIEKC